MSTYALNYTANKSTVEYLSYDVSWLQPANGGGKIV